MYDIVTEYEPLWKRVQTLFFQNRESFETLKYFFENESKHHLLTHTRKHTWVKCVYESHVCKNYIPTENITLKPCLNFDAAMAYLAELIAHRGENVVFNPTGSEF